jgi:hypothetical protein
MAKAAGEDSTHAGSRPSRPLQSRHWIGFRAAVEHRLRQLGATDPAMGERAIKEIDDALKSGALQSKLIEGDHELLVAPERWREDGGDLIIRAERWIDGGVDWDTLRVELRGKPERQVLLLVWAPDLKPPTVSALASPSKRRAQPQGDRIEIALRAEFPPDGKVPPRSKLSDAELVARVRKHFPAPEKSGGLAIPSPKSVLRTVGRLSRK